MRKVLEGKLQDVTAKVEHIIENNNDHRLRSDRPRAQSSPPRYKNIDEEEIKKVAFVKGFDEDTKAPVIAKSSETFLKEVVGVKESRAASFRSEKAVVTFVSSEARRAFLKKRIKIMFEGKELFAVPKLTKKEYELGKPVGKLKKVFAQRLGGADGIETRRGPRGAVWVKDAKVGGYEKNSTNFVIFTDVIDKLDLGFSGKEIEEAFNKEME